MVFGVDTMATTKVTRASASVKLALKLKAEAEGGCGGEIERVAGWQHQTHWWLLGLVFPPRIFRRMDERFLQFYSLTAGIGILLQPEMYR